MTEVMPRSEKFDQDPSPVPRRLVNAPAAVHPLPWERAGVRP